MPEHREPLDRRAFLSHAAVLGAAAAGGVRLPDVGPAAPRSVTGSTSAPAGFELEEVTVAELQAGMASGRYTARRIVEQYLERIAAMDRTGAWSARGGQCRNPYLLDRNPCGSSSGSAAAVSANFGAVAIGTETDGSIVCPASANGVVGIKPTVGLVSRAGIIPISHTQDTAGPLCRTVADAATLLGALAGGDPRDKATAAAAGHLKADYTKFL